MSLLSDLFKNLFVPDESGFNNISNVWNEKLGFVNTIKDSFNNISEMIQNTQANPKFIIGVSSDVYSGDLTVIDLSWYAPFKPWVDLVITGFIYLFFIWRFFSHLPAIISGFSSVGGIAENFDKYEGGR